MKMPQLPQDSGLIPVLDHSTFIRFNEDAMTGRRRHSFRAGDLAETVGIVLLRGVAAVAEVSRTEDVGLDAIASLLRLAEDRNLYAEDSFVVQLKAISQKKLQYRGHALSWFLQQTQPMFVGRVSLKDARISLYPTIHVNQAILSLAADSVTLRFTESPTATGRDFQRWRIEKDNSATVYLGLPLLTWSIADLVDSSWRLKTYSVLKKFIRIAQIELHNISLGQFSLIIWKTNNEYSIVTQISMVSEPEKEFTALAENGKAWLRSIQMGTNCLPHESAKKVLDAVAALYASLRDIGIDLDEINLSRTLLENLNYRMKISEIESNNPTD